MNAIDREKRFKQLKKERNKWWEDVAPHIAFREPADKKETVPAFHLNKDGTISKVYAWVDDTNYKRVSCLTGSKKYHQYASGRTWPTKEGALFDKVERARKLSDRCAKAYAEANKELSGALKELAVYLTNEGKEK